MRSSSAIRKAAVVALVLGAASGPALAQGKPPPKSNTSTPQPGAPAPTEPAATENPSGPNPSGPSAEAVPAASEADATLIVASATIVRIDKSARKLTLVGPDGQSFDVKAGPNVDLDALAVGDRVNASYYEEVAVGINPHPHGGARVALRTVQRGGVTAKQATVTAHILGVNVADDTVLVRMPDGRQHTVKVADPALQAELPKIRAGADVDLTYTQAVATDIEPVTEQPAQPEQPVLPAQPAPSGPGAQPAR